MLQIGMAAAGSVGFALLFGVRGKKLFWIALGGAAGFGAYQLFLWMGKGLFPALLLATLLTALFSEALARLKKAPVLLFLVPMLIPLIPGGDLYYAMQSFVQDEGAAFGERVRLVLSEAGAIALGILCAASGVNVFKQILHRTKRPPFFQKCIARHFPAAYNKTDPTKGGSDMHSNRFGIPKADYFTENNNRYTGSEGSFRFCIDAGGDTLRVLIWHGEKCLEKSEVEIEKEFSKDAEGFSAAVQWLESQGPAAV